MSANLEWGIPFTIQSSKGTLALNEVVGDGYYLLIEDNCEARRPLRVTVDDVPQGDGSIPHHRFTGGYEVNITLALWEASRQQPACDEQARLMAEELMLHLNCLLNDDGRLFWTPSGLGDQRLLDNARLREVSAWTFGQAGDPRITFRLDSPFPYVYDFAQESVSLAASTPQSVTNEGNVDTFPVIRVLGPTTAFSLENETLSQAIVYDSGLPGAVDIGVGEYMEFDFFRNTAYLNGTGASGKPGIDVELSDFWVLQASTPNSIESSGAASTLLFNHSYA
jgi:hypothetical protein